MSHRSARSTLSLLAIAALIVGTTGGAIAAPTKIPTTLTISAWPDPAWVGETVTVTYTVTPIPDGGSVFTTGAFHPLDLQTGTYTEQRTYPSAGNPWQISALYSGTDLYMGTSYVYGGVVVRQHAVSAQLEVPGAPIGRGDPFDVTVDLDEAPDGGRVLIQEMSFGNPGPTLRVFDVQGTQPMTITIPGLDPGDYHLRAFFEGTDAYAPATSVTLPITVFDRPTTTTLVIAPDPSLPGEPVEATVTVAPVPDDAGGVYLVRDGSQVGWFDMDWATGIGTALIGRLDSGSHTLKAVFLPTGAQVTRWGPSSDTVTQTVGSTPIEDDPPVGTVLIDGGATLTASGYVVVSMHATDESGIVQTQMSCDGVSWVNAGTDDGDWGWGIGNGGPDCVRPDGLSTVYVRWRDRWGTWGQASDSIILDASAPIGSVEPEDGTPFTDTPTVTLDVTASDAGSGVAAMALSNDGSTWTEMDYAPTVEWSLGPDTLTPAAIARSWTRSFAVLDLPDGAKTVYAKWRDANGHWSTPATTSIVLDREAPEATGPRLSFRSGTALLSGKVTVRSAWTGADALAGIAAFDVALRTDGGAFVTIATNVPRAWIDRALRPQHHYAVKVRPVDRAGNVGAWVVGSTFAVSLHSEASTRITYKSSWSTTRSSVFLGGAAKRSSTAGAKASFTFTGHSVAWVSRTGPGQGKASVYVNGLKVATIDLRASAYHRQRVVWAATWSTAISRKVTIRVTGTSGHPRVDLDAFIAAS